MSNFFAQAQALMNGVTEEEIREELAGKGFSQERIDLIAPHKVHAGNRPTNTILLKQIDPTTLGSLIAAYEHKIFVQGVVLKICSFDQWGVELGKGLANNILSDLETKSNLERHDSSTKNLMEYYLKEVALLKAAAKVAK